MSIMNLDSLKPEELVDGFMIAEPLTPEEKYQAHQQLAEFRHKRALQPSEQEELYGKLLQLKIHIEDYIKQESYDPEKSFAHFLKAYVDLQPKKKKEVAGELDIHKTLLSQLLSGHREPFQELFIRLEYHSNQFIPARDWFRLVMKQNEYTLINNQALRNQAKQHVKAHLFTY